jgi:hypothetical protein
MPTSQARICRICFGVLLALGVGLLVMGLLIVPVLPHFQLDVVLTPAELADTHKREATLRMLRIAIGNQWLFWTGAGLVAICASSIGLWTMRSESMKTRKTRRNLDSTSW